jgi:hypothetical protein
MDWNDELAEAGLSAEEWVTKRLTNDAVYVSVGDGDIDRLRRECPAQVQSTLAAASRVLAHEFDLLGSGPFTPRDPERSRDATGYQPIDWYLDPVSNQRFPRAVPLAQWNFEAMRPAGADIKLPWELARCQHWPLLGQAYRLTGDDRFALEISRELEDFVAANPVGTAVNWACTMDVALRAANWAIGFDLVRASPALTAEFWRRAYRALFDHGAFIETHLENTYEVTSNHFLSNVVGLFFVAAVFDNLQCGSRWNRQCRQWTSDEIKVQVLPDGADYESSVPYHRLVVELFLGVARLADFKGDPLPQETRIRLASMVDFLAATLRPDGLMPLVGDADDGRLHILSGYGGWNPQDARHLFGPAAAVLGRPEWSALAGEWGPWETTWWGLRFPQPPGAAPSPPEGLKHFSDAGLTVMRCRRDYLVVTNGIVGTGGFGNHKHNDLLGFEYHADGVPVLVDPGSFVYTSNPDARNLFRSTASHNTVSVDGEEQNEIRPGYLFRMFEQGHPEHLELDEGRDLLRYRGRHRGYTRLAEPVTVERTFTLSRKTRLLTIVDCLEGDGVHRIRWHFHFAPGVEVSVVNDDRLEIHARELVLEMIVPSSLRPSHRSGWYSPSYGVRVPCACVDFETEQALNRRSEYCFEIKS